MSQPRPFIGPPIRKLSLFSPEMLTEEKRRRCCRRHCMADPEIRARWNESVIENREDSACTVHVSPSPSVSEKPHQEIACECKDNKCMISVCEHSGRAVGEDSVCKSARDDSACESRPCSCGQCAGKSKGTQTGACSRSCAGFYDLPFKDQNETPWQMAHNRTQHNTNMGNQQVRLLEDGQHTELVATKCQALLAKHHSHSAPCVGLCHDKNKNEEQQRYLLSGRDQDDKCNIILQRLWCEQQAHQITNNCYFISELEKLCFDAFKFPCDQVYGFLDRGPINSIPHAWVKLGDQKQLIDVTFYRDKSSKLPNFYWIPLKEYKDGARPATMKDENDFKKNNHWKYVVLCTLVKDRRKFMRCIFKFMKEEMAVEMVDIFWAAASYCWNCNKKIAAPVKCPNCSTAVFCGKKCMKEEAAKQVSHREICDDFALRLGEGTLKPAGMLKQPVTSMKQLLQERV